MKSRTKQSRLSTYIVCNSGSSKPVWNLSAQIKKRYPNLSPAKRSGISLLGKPLSAASSTRRVAFAAPAAAAGAST